MAMQPYARVAVGALLIGLAGCDAGVKGGANGEPGAPPAPSAADPAASGSALPATSASAAAAPAEVPPKNLNVLFLSIDALRHEVPWHGYERDIAPNLTKLAAESTVYTRAYTVSSSTAKSIGVWLGGNYPSALYRSGYFFTAYADANVWITELMQPKGIRTLSGQAHKYFDRDKNLEQGFDVWEMTPDIEFDSTTDNNVTSPKSLELILKHVKDPVNNKGQFFAWYHLMDPHDQYIQHAESPVFGKSARDRFDAEIHYTDMHIGKAIEYIRSQPWGERTAIIVTADHGEAFGEHKQHRHAFDLWQVLVKVPLVIYAPGAKPQRIEERRSQIDLSRTILELMGVDAPKEMAGKSMVAEIYGKEKPENREPILMELPADSNNPSVRAMVLGDYKIMVFGSGQTVRLYNIKDDPGELKDLKTTEKAKLEEMRKRLDEEWAKIPSIRPYGGNKLTDGGAANGPETPEQKEKLGAQQVWR